MKSIQKKICILVLIILCISGVKVAYNEFGSSSFSSKNLIRLHVIANSDAVYDQKIKLLVKEDIIKLMKPYFQQANSVKEARTIAQKHLPQIQQIAIGRLASLETGYNAKAEIGEFNFPTKSYGDFTLPAGKYEAVRVVLGEGKGRNWWCVLFPPLCFVDISKTIAVDFDDIEDSVIKEVQQVDARPLQVEIRFKILELWKKTRYNIAKDDNE